MRLPRGLRPEAQTQVEVLRAKAEDLAIRIVQRGDIEPMPTSEFVGSTLLVRNLPRQLIVVVRSLELSELLIGHFEASHIGRQRQERLVKAAEVRVRRCLHSSNARDRAFEGGALVIESGDFLPHALNIVGRPRAPDAEIGKLPREVLQMRLELLMIALQGPRTGGRLLEGLIQFVEDLVITPDSRPELGDLSFLLKDKRLLLK
jgi:hypothetical protein